VRKLVVVAFIGLAVAAVATASVVRLTGYGATRTAWAAHHQADTSPKLVKGCCYLPKQADGLDRYLGVQPDKHGRVDSYTLHFAPRVSPSAARALLRRTELPTDAKLVRVKHSPYDNCVILQYRSEAAKRAVGSAFIGARLYSHDEGLYTGRVRNVYVTRGTVIGC
jgi:hypothetical protein